MISLFNFRAKYFLIFNEKFQEDEKTGEIHQIDPDVVRQNVYVSH